MRTPVEQIGKELREYIVDSSTHFLHYHDKEGRTTEGKALFLGGPLDMVIARVEAIVRDERQHQAKLEAEIEHLTKSGIIEVAVRNPAVAEYCRHWEGRTEKAEQQLAQLQEENTRLKERKTQ